MNLGQCHKKFATVTAQAWDGSAWVSGQVKGSLKVYTRSLTDRSVGVIKRFFMSRTQIDPSFNMLKLPDETIYLILKVTKDMQRDSVYGYIYMLLEAPFTASIQEVQSEYAPSGVKKSTNTLAVISQVPCYLERNGNIDSREVDSTTYNRVEVFFPKGTTITNDQILSIEGQTYIVRQTYKDQDLVVARTVQE